MMQFRIEHLSNKRFVGEKTVMSLVDDKTFELWHHFMPRSKEIDSRIGLELYSIEDYTSDYFENFTPANLFVKWAAVQVAENSSVPTAMEAIYLGGLFAVFTYKGNPNDGVRAYQYIYSEWLPSSDYLLDDRPHFAVMGNKYRHNSVDSEEELWIPVKQKAI